MNFLKSVNILVYEYLAKYKEEGDCLVHFARLATALLKVEESAQHNPLFLPVTVPNIH